MSRHYLRQHQLLPLQAVLPPCPCLLPWHSPERATARQEQDKQRHDQGRVLSGTLRNQSQHVKPTGTAGGIGCC
jgi:hypothetical protein